ncbi:MAG: LPP20 family lipoprotein [Spirochaetaceae bacterium]
MKRFVVRITMLALAAVVFLVGCASGPGPAGGGASGGSSGDGGVRTTAAGEPIPEWYENPKSVYPDDQYLSAVGSGDTRRSAEQDALGALSQIFEARVTVDNRVNERYREIAGASGNFSESDVRLANSVNVQSDQRLVNVQYGESFTDSQGRVHVIAYMNRMETGRVYRDLIRKNAAQIERFLEEAETEERILRRFAFVSAANVIAQSNRALIDQLQIISAPLAATLQLPYDEQAVAERRLDVASEMAYRVNVSGGAASRVEEVVAGALSSEGFVVSSGGPLLVRGSAELEAAEGGRYEEVRWYLNLEFVGPDGSTVVAFNQQDRASGVTEDAARSFAYGDIETVATEDFVGQVIGYFDSLVIQ